MPCTVHRPFGWLRRVSLSWRRKTAVPDADRPWAEPGSRVWRLVPRCLGFSGPEFTRHRRVASRPAPHCLSKGCIASKFEEFWCFGICCDFANLVKCHAHNLLYLTFVCIWVWLWKKNHTKQPQACSILSFSKMVVVGRTCVMRLHFHYSWKP